MGIGVCIVGSIEAYNKAEENTFLKIVDSQIKQHLKHKRMFLTPNKAAHDAPKKRIGRDDTDIVVNQDRVNQRSDGCGTNNHIDDATIDLAYQNDHVTRINVDDNEIDDYYNYPDELVLGDSEKKLQFEKEESRDDDRI